MIRRFRIWRLERLLKENTLNLGAVAEERAACQSMLAHLQSVPNSEGRLVCETMSRHLTLHEDQLLAYRAALINQLDRLRGVPL